MHHTFLVLTVKKVLKSVYIYGSYRKIKTGVSLFLDHPADCRLHQWYGYTIRPIGHKQSSHRAKQKSPNHCICLSRIHSGLRLRLSNHWRRSRVWHPHFFPGFHFAPHPPLSASATTEKWSHPDKCLNYIPHSKNRAPPLQRRKLILATSLYGIISLSFQGFLAFCQHFVHQLEPIERYVSYAIMWRCSFTFSSFYVSK